MISPSVEAMARISRRRGPPRGQGERLDGPCGRAEHGERPGPRRPPRTAVPRPVSAGIISADPPKASPARYGIVVPQVDADGNDLDGSAFVQVPIGTYTGRCLFNRSFFEDGICSLQGSFIPFARTKAERLAAGDRRLSIEERYSPL
jgi:hypothetical protein